jgi:hypothetical protein
MCSVLILSGCKKDKAEAPNDILQQGKWRWSELSFHFYVNDVLTDVTRLDDLDSCTRDNYFLFQPDDVLIMDEGPMKCDSSSPQEIHGTWKLSANGKQFIMGADNSTENQTFEIVTLNTSVFKIASDLTFFDSSLQMNFRYVDTIVFRKMD